MFHGVCVVYLKPTGAVLARKHSQFADGRAVVGTWLQGRERAEADIFWLDRRHSRKQANDFQRTNEHQNFLNLRPQRLVFRKIADDFHRAAGQHTARAHLSLHSNATDLQSRARRVRAPPCCCVLDMPNLSNRCGSWKLVCFAPVYLVLHVSKDCLFCC